MVSHIPPFDASYEQTKANAMMIPFQLEEKLPYPISQSCYVSWVEKKKEKSHVIVSIVQKNDFQNYYDLLVQMEIVPSVLTSELFVINSYLKNNSLSRAAVIFDLGHEMTKAYFIHDGVIVSNQTSYVAGKIIDEAISKLMVSAKKRRLIINTKIVFLSLPSSMKVFLLNKKNLSIL